MIYEEIGLLTGSHPWIRLLPHRNLCRKPGCPSSVCTGTQDFHGFDCCYNAPGLQAGERFNLLSGRTPQIELNGQLRGGQYRRGRQAGPGCDPPDLPIDLIGNNELVAGKLEKEGSTDLSYSLPGMARFRVNIFRQRGSYAIVMRVIPQTVPDFKSLNLPAQLGEIAELRMASSSSLALPGPENLRPFAAILNKINEEKAYHILTIEDPIEFLHLHKKIHDSPTRTSQRHSELCVSVASGPCARLPR